MMYHTSHAFIIHMFSSVQIVPKKLPPVILGSKDSGSPKNVSMLSPEVQFLLLGHTRHLPGPCRRCGKEEDCSRRVDFFRFSLRAVKARWENQIMNTYC